MRNEERLSREDDIFLNNELRRIEKAIIDVDYPDMPFATGKIIPISTELPAGTKWYSYKIRNKLGMSKVIANPADDLPRVGIDYKEVAGKIINIGNEFGYTFKDIRASKVANKPLESDLMFSSKEANMLLFDNVLQYGDAFSNILGLYNNPNVTEYAVGTGGTGSPNTLWISAGVGVKTADQIIADICGLIRSVVVTSKGIKKVNRLLMPLEHHTYITQTPRSAVSDKTIFDWVKSVNPGVEFIPLHSLEKTNLTANGILGPDGVSALTGSMMVAMSVSIDSIRAHNPLVHTLHPMYQKGLELITPTEMEFGGVDIKKPIGFAYAKNI